MADLLPSHRLTFVLSADDAYARPLAVAAYSALAHLAPNWSADIYVIDGGISAAHRARIARVVEAAPAPTTLHWLTVRPDRVQDLPVLNDWISTSAYLRLYLPELLPNTCERVIYLDSDLLVNASLVPLWTEPLDEVALCAVQDYYTPYVSSTRGLDYYQELDLSPRTPYFNAGVMAINLSYWRAHNIGQTALQYIETYRDRLNFHDQEGLNAAVAGRWKPLDPTWNLFVTPDRLKHVPHSEVRSALEARPDLFDTAHIHHFAGATKPWELGSAYHLMQGLWHSYLWQSAWHTPEERWTSIAAFVPQYARGRISHVARERTRSVRHWMAPYLPSPIRSLIRK